MLEQQLVTLLLKLAVSASLASILLRSGLFKRMLLREQRTLKQRMQMALVFATIFGASSAARIITNNSYLATDLSLEGSLLAGVLGEGLAPRGNRARCRRDLGGGSNDFRERGFEILRCGVD